ncbi:hypothetical protein F4680DRAFT_469100 [Xylaria scruposa]|nr:hypothetical protein F4680DRAFT_469100 [Xylaria scruposa]
MRDLLLPEYHIMCVLETENYFHLAVFLCAFQETSHHGHLTQTAGNPPPRNRQWSPSNKEPKTELKVLSHLKQNNTLLGHNQNLALNAVLVEMAQRLIEQVKSLFANHPRHVFERVAGQGGSGIALCFQDKEAGPDEFSRFIVKTVLLGTDIEIQNEKRWLQKLRWAEHIVTSINLDPNPLETFNKPHLIIEYLENGTLDALLQRRRAAGLGRLPNRVLWAIFLCLVRACVAMAHPSPPIPNLQTPKVKTRETLPENDGAQTPDHLVHGDMNLGNLMFGDLNPSKAFDPPNTEHNLVPALKLIDFGDAHEVVAPVEERPSEYDRRLYLFTRMSDDLGRLRDIGKPSDAREDFQNDATDLNVLEIGVVMGRLITNDLTNPRAGVMREIILELHGDVDAIAGSGLDMDLFWLVARCLACQAFLRPRLSHLLDLLEQYTNKVYEDMVDESDLSITKMIQSYIFDADGPAGGANNVIVLSPDPVAPDGSVASSGDGQDNPIELDAESPADNVSNASQEDAANHPIDIISDISADDASIASVNQPSQSSSSQGSPLQGTAANPIMIEVSVSQIPSFVVAFVFPILNSSSVAWGEFSFAFYRSRTFLLCCV